MTQEIIKEFVFKTNKPETKIEAVHFRKFKVDIKTLLKEGNSKIKVLEKFRDYAFFISDHTPEEEEKLIIFIKDNKTVNNYL
ncbi:MAG: hypothetical protein H0W73_08320 [Bacteroidetes bacterium]|nr:hypothetical protein [Bacteroidota bacterium]